MILKWFTGTEYCQFEKTLYANKYGEYCTTYEQLGFDIIIACRASRIIYPIPFVFENEEHLALFQLRYM